MIESNRDTGGAGCYRNSGELSLLFMYIFCPRIGFQSFVYMNFMMSVSFAPNSFLQSLEALELENQVGCLNF